MKKVLLILVATAFSFSAAMADVMVTAGMSFNNSVFAAEGKERNYDYAGTIATTTVEYGAVKDSYSSIFAEVGMDYSKAAKSIADSGEPGFAWL